MDESGQSADGGTETVADSGAESTQEATTTTQEPSNQDRLAEQMEALANENREFRAQFDEWRNSQIEEAPEEDPYEGMEDEDRAHAEALDQWLDERLNERMKPLQQEQAMNERNREWDSLRERFNELQDEKVAGPIAQEAARFLQEIGRPDLIDTKHLVRVIEMQYKAQKADERAARETPARGEQTVLEGGGGAAPTNQEDDDDAIRRRIMNSGGSSDFL